MALFCAKVKMIFLLEMKKICFVINSDYFVNFVVGEALLKRDI